MAKRTRIKDIFTVATSRQYTVMGWVRTFRNNQFIALNDGSCLANLQVVVDFENWDAALLKRITTGAALHIEGKLIASQGKGQTVELVAEKIHILGDCDPEIYPLQPKKHSLEFLREIAHLRFRTNTFSAISRVKQTLFYGIHKFFNDRDFVNVHSPIITGSDAEGAGEMFQVTTLDLNKLPQNDDGSINYKEDFFGKATNLTVSGQLEAELAALALGSVYTFGPTFRAEKSNTPRHLAEFWMMEPEVAFNDLHDNMDLAEDMLKFLIQYALDHCVEDLAFLEQRLIDDEKTKPQAERSEMTLIEKLKFCLEHPFERLTYTEAIEILKNSTPNKKGKFQYPIEKWGADLQSEHERYLVEKHFKKPVILTNYPADIKAFYMRQDDPKDGVPGPTVSAMDILFPGIGEIIGGSQREERLDLLVRRMNEMHIPAEEMSWFLDTRRFGTVPHAGFGLGFERLVLFVTGMTNIRDVIPFPRFPGNAEF
ncbi:MAG: asparagine--tRNA ligase [Saprospiraceae bacterium]|jgi:asparaginyl-tRNA synthetase|nr:asparagine--tRNA ligase [Saprospiraceae bacterium]